MTQPELGPRSLSSTREARSQPWTRRGRLPLGGAGEPGIIARARRETPSPHPEAGSGSLGPVQSDAKAGRKGRRGDRVPGHGVHSSAALTKSFRNIFGRIIPGAIQRTSAGPWTVRRGNTARGKKHFFPRVADQHPRCGAGAREARQLTTERCACAAPPPRALSLSVPYSLWSSSYHVSPVLSVQVQRRRVLRPPRPRLHGRVWSSAWHVLGAP